jgi:hypothetical protein
MFTIADPEGDVGSLGELRIRLGLVPEVLHVVFNFVPAPLVLHFGQGLAVISPSSEFKLMYLLFSSTDRERHLNVVAPGSLLLALSSHALLASLQ